MTSYSRVPRPFKTTSYDGIFYAKINLSFPVLYDATNGIAFFCVNWGSPYGGAANYGCDIRDSSEFNGYVGIFNFWRAIGLKIKFFPAGNFTGTTSLAFYHTEVASFPDAEVLASTG